MRLGTVGIKAFYCTAVAIRTREGTETNFRVKTQDIVAVAIRTREGTETTIPNTRSLYRSVAIRTREGTETFNDIQQYPSGRVAIRTREGTETPLNVPPAATRLLQYVPVRGRKLPFYSEFYLDKRCNTYP